MRAVRAGAPTSPAAWTIGLYSLLAGRMTSRTLRLA
jgi:hypothetical protein